MLSEQEKQYLPRLGDHETLIQNPLNELIETILKSMWIFDQFLQKSSFVQEGLFLVALPFRPCHPDVRVAEEGLKRPQSKLSSTSLPNAPYSHCKYFAGSFPHSLVILKVSSEGKCQLSRWLAWWTWKREAGRPKKHEGFAQKVSQGFLFGTHRSFCHGLGNWSPKKAELYPGQDINADVIACEKNAEV